MRIMPGGALEGEQDLGPSSVFVGRKLDEHRGAFVLEYPMDKGVVTENGWDSMERLWEVGGRFNAVFVATCWKRPSLTLPKSLFSTFIRSSH
jgi:hypothetical protein